MPLGGSLTLQLTDVRGNYINDTARIELLAASGSNRYSNQEPVQGGLTLTGIACEPARLYHLAVWPTRYRPRQVFIALKAGRTATRKLVFPVQPRKVRGLQVPPYNELTAPLRNILERPVYEALKPLQQACLLNLAAKTSATILGDGRSCLEHLGGLLRIQQDRMLARTHAAMEEEASQLPLFRPVSGRLHAPPPGYRHGRSFKTGDQHGNLQLTFFRRGETGDDYLVDADIDEARGIPHIFEVTRNTLAGRTHPYNVREILIAGQGLDPGYSFVFT